MNKKANTIYGYVRESIDNAIDNLFAILDVTDNLTLNDKEAVLKDIYLLLSIKYTLGGD